jgi:hypothetical protein
VRSKTRSSPAEKKLRRPICPPPQKINNQTKPNQTKPPKTQNTKHKKRNSTQFMTTLATATADEMKILKESKEKYHKSIKFISNYFC